MAKYEKYLLTVDAETGAPVKIEHMGEAGELTEVPLEGLRVGTPAATSPQVVNIYVGTLGPTGLVGLPESQEKAVKLGPQPPVSIFHGPLPPKGGSKKNKKKA